MKKQLVLKVFKMGEPDSTCYIIFNSHAELPEIDRETYNYEIWLCATDADVSICWDR